LWNSFRTDQQLGLTAEITTFSGNNDDTIHAYVARPTTPGPHPGIVAVHHMPGWDEYYQEFSERLARHGYIVITPNLYERFGHGTPDEVTATVRADGGVDDASVVGDCAAALDWLKEQPDFNGKVGVIGSCSGGRQSVIVASQVPGFSAVVDLWGGGLVPVPDAPPNPKKPAAGIEYTPQLNVPLLGIFGNDDSHPTPEQVDIHEAELQKYGKDYEFHRFDDAGHGFFYYHTPNYRPRQAMEAWGIIFGFLDKNLSSDGKSAGS
jgi:carboxymethylenebutenolidase